MRLLALHAEPAALASMLARARAEDDDDRANELLEALKECLSDVPEKGAPLAAPLVAAAVDLRRRGFLFNWASDQAFEILIALKEHAAPAAAELIALVKGLRTPLYSDYGGPNDLDQRRTTLSLSENRERDTNLQIKQSALRVLSGLGEAAAPIMDDCVSLLESTDYGGSHLREVAAAALGRLAAQCAPATVGAVAALLASPVSRFDNVKAVALCVLGNMLTALAAADPEIVAAVRAEAQVPSLEGGTPVHMAKEALENIERQVAAAARGDAPEFERFFERRYVRNHVTLYDDPIA